jgi:hypothetical protein
MNERLSDYVARSLERGMKREQIRESLVAAGHAEDVIKDALDAWIDHPASPLPVPRRKVSATFAETSLYLLMFFCFLFVSIGMLDILFAVINHLVPDPDRYSNNGWAYSVRLGASFLTVFFPIYALLYARASKAVLRDPARRESSVRRLMINAALVVSVGAALISMATLVYDILEWQGNVNGGIKLATVIAIASLTFANYWWELKRQAGTAGPTLLRRVFTAIVMLGVVGLTIYGVNVSLSHRQTPYEAPEKPAVPAPAEPLPR